MIRVWRTFTISVVVVHGLALGLGIFVGLRSLTREPTGVGEDWSLFVTFFVFVAVIVSVVCLIPMALLVRNLKEKGFQPGVRTMVLLFSALHIALPLLGIVWLGFAYFFLLPALVAIPTSISLTKKHNESQGETR